MRSIAVFRFSESLVKLVIFCIFVSILLLVCYSGFGLKCGFECVVVGFWLRFIRWLLCGFWRILRVLLGFPIFLSHKIAFCMRKKAAENDVKEPVKIRLKELKELKELNLYLRPEVTREDKK